MGKMTGGPARRWSPGMTTVSKDDIQHMKPSLRNRLRRDGFTWAQIKKIDQAMGRGESEITLKSADSEITLSLPPKWR